MQDNWFVDRVTSDHTKTIESAIAGPMSLKEAEDTVRRLREQDPRMDYNVRFEGALRVNEEAAKTCKHRAIEAHAINDEYNSPWKARCTICNHPFDVVWTDRINEDERVEGLELIVSRER